MYFSIFCSPEYMAFIAFNCKMTHKALQFSYHLRFEYTIKQKQKQSQLKILSTFTKNMKFYIILIHTMRQLYDYISYSFHLQNVES